MKFYPFFSTAFIGLDVQPEGIRLVQLKKMKHTFLVERMIIQDLPYDVFAEGKIKRWDVLHSHLAEVVAMQQINGKQVAIHVPAHLVRMQHINIAAGLAEKAIEAEIYDRLQQDMPGLSDALCLDYHEFPHQAPGTSVLSFVAGRKEYLFQYVDCINSVGLQVKIVDVDIYALKRAICFAWQLSPERKACNAILSRVNSVDILIIYDAQGIRFYQHLDNHESVDSLMQLRQKIQLFFATFPEAQIHHLLLSPPRYADQYEEMVTAFGIQVHPINLSATLTFATSAEAEWMGTQPDVFLIAIGLAMREIPRW